MIGQYLQRLHQGISPDRSMANKGGGGGSSPYYANMDRLYGAQSRAAEFMLDQSMPYIPQYMANSNQMVDEAMDGTLANKMRQAAGNDAAAANGNSWGVMNRNMQRMGANFSTDRMLSEANKNSVMGAANMTGALNNATAAAEDMKWNRNAGAFGQATGMGSGAMSSLGSAAAGYGSAGNSMMANESANAAGMGQFGAGLAYSAMKADGGYIDGKFKRVDGSRKYADGGEVKPGLHMASGGSVWDEYKAKNPIVTTGAPKSGGASPLLSIAAGAAPYAVGAGIKAGVKSDAFQDNVATPIKNAINKALGNTVPKPEEAQMSVDPNSTIGKLLPSESLEISKPGMDTSAISRVDAVTPVAEAAVPDMVVETAKEPLAQAATDTASNLLPEVLDAGSTTLLGILKKDGGYISKPGLKLAMGGMAKSMRMPSIASMDSSSQMKISSQPAKVKMPSVAKSSGVAQQAQSTLSPGAAISGGHQAYDSLEKTPTGAEGAQNTGIASADTTANATEQIQNADAATDTMKNVTEAGQTADAASTATNASEGAASSAVPYGSILKAGLDIASGRDAGTAVADAAASYAGAQAGMAAGTAILPGVGTVIGGALGGLLGGSLFADGGTVQAKKHGLRLATGGMAQPLNTQRTMQGDTKKYAGPFDHIQQDRSFEQQFNRTLDRGPGFQALSDYGLEQGRSGKTDSHNLSLNQQAASWSGDPVISYLMAANGGDVSKNGLRAGRVDHTGGGKVSGPGTETSDDIPAWLSDGEFVLNAEAVKMVGKQKLEKINEKGLEKREAKEEKAEGKAHNTQEERQEGYAKGGLVRARRPVTKQLPVAGSSDVPDSVVAERAEKFRGTGKKIDRRLDDAVMAKSAGLSLARGGYAKKGC